MSGISIAGRLIGSDQSPYVIAELSGNHNGQIERAFALMEMAKRCGADAVKLQTYTADTMTIDSTAEDFQIKGGLWDGRSLYDLYCEAQTPWEWHPALFAKGHELGLTVFSTPFDDTAIELLESLNAPAYKIASFELIDHELIRRVAATGKPTIISTGMGTPDDIAEAVTTYRDAGGQSLILLHCVSGYPAPANQSNLRRIPALAAKYKCPVGLSDHTMGTEVAIASTSLGACVIEKHITLARSDGGPDAAFSLEPDELESLTRGVRNAFAALGTGAEDRSEIERDNAVFRRSIYVVRDIARGEEFSRENIKVIRPGFGLEPKHMPRILGRTSKEAISRGTALSWAYVE